MHGVVSLLEDRFYNRVEEIWAKLERKFGVRGIYVTPFPHFSYQVAKHYDLGSLEIALHNLAMENRTFRIRTGGLGIFLGEKPVIYIPVVRSLELSSFHQMVWREMADVASHPVAYYQPDRWLPHITLGHSDITSENLPEIVAYLQEFDFDWEMTVDSLALIHDAGDRQEIRCRYYLAKGDRG